MTEDRSVLSRPARMPDRSWTYGEHSDQVIEVYQGVCEPALVLIHGGYWRPEYDRTHLRPMAAALADAGWTCHLIEYRRQPGNPAAMTSDVSSSMAAVAADQGPTGVIAVGHSAGGHLALHAAASGPDGLRAVVALAPVADLGAALAHDLDDGAARAFLGDVPHEEVCPVAGPTPPVPVVILHGDRDDLVPIDQSRAYVGAHPGTELVELPGIAHFAVIDPQSNAWPAVLIAIQRAAESATRPG